MATNICSNTALSNEVAKQGLTDMYLPTLKLREARSPTYWAIAESNHQSNINLLPKPSPREYRPKNVDYNSPFGSVPYIARPAASSVVNLVPLQPHETSNKPARLTSLEIPNISVNAVESLDNADDQRQAGIVCEGVCCSSQEQGEQQFGYDEGRSENKMPYSRETRDQPVHWPVIEIGEAPNDRNNLSKNCSGGLCCPGMFGRTNEYPNAATKDLLDIRSLSQDISYTRPSHDHTRSGDQGNSNAFTYSPRDHRQERSTADKPQMPRDWQNQNVPDRLDYDSSLDIASSPVSEINYNGSPSHPTEGQQADPQYRSDRSRDYQPVDGGPSRPAETQTRPDRSQNIQPGSPRPEDKHYSPSAWPERQNGNRGRPEAYPAESQTTIRPFAPPPTQGSPTDKWNPSQFKPQSAENRAPRPVYWGQVKQTASPLIDLLEETGTSQKQPTSAFCGDRTTTNEGDPAWPISSGHYSSPEGVVNPAHLGPPSRTYEPLCGGCIQQETTSAWSPELPATVEQSEGDILEEVHTLVTNQTGPMVETGALKSYARGCCEAEFVRAEPTERRVSEPTNRIIRALSPRGLCGGPPANRKLPHIEHYDVVQ